MTRLLKKLGFLVIFGAALWTTQGRVHADFCSNRQNVTFCHTWDHEQTAAFCYLNLFVSWCNDQCQESGGSPKPGCVTWPEEDTMSGFCFCELDNECKGEWEPCDPNGGSFCCAYSGLECQDYSCVHPCSAWGQECGAGEPDCCDVMLVTT